MMDSRFIPLYNKGRQAFESPEIQENIRFMLNNADMVTVTTDYIKESYHKYYGVPLEKIVAVPNLLPKYLFGDRYNPTEKINQFKFFKNKPRIGIISSLSHYNIENVRQDENGRACRLKEMLDPKTGKQIMDENGKPLMKWINQDGIEVPEEKTSVINDDLDIILDCIRETVNEVQWVFFGFSPPKLKDLIESGKIEVHGGVQIMNYPSKFDNLKLQAVVAPIIDMEFNRCKSFIKYMECAALGVPLFASRCLPYNRVMPESQMFSSSEELKDMIHKLKFSSNGAYQKMIERQWKWLNTPCVEGDFQIKSFWLEDNLNIYVDKYRMRPKCGLCSMDYYFKLKEQNEQKKKEQTIFSNDNGVEILR